MLALKPNLDEKRLHVIRHYLYLPPEGHAVQQTFVAVDQCYQNYSPLSINESRRLIQISHLLYNFISMLRTSADTDHRQ